MPTKSDYQKTKYRRENGLAWCSSCKADLPQSDFEPSPGRRPFGLSSLCKTCNRKRKKDFGKKTYWNLSPEERELRNRKRNLQKFGMTIEQYNEMLESQNHLCSICQKPEVVKHHSTGKPSRLVVDHNHATNTVRGLLCTKCNKGIGLLGDDPENLIRAAEYLRDSSCESNDEQVESEG